MDVKKQVCGACRVEAEKILAETSKCCVVGELKLRAEHLLKMKLVADKSAMQYSMESGQLREELEGANAQILELKTLLAGEKNKVEEISLKLEETKKLLEEKRVEIEAVETAQAMRGMAIQTPFATETTRNPCVILYADKGLRKIRRGKPEIDLYTELAGSVTFGESICRKTLTVEETVAGIKEYLNKNPGMKSHIFCHLGRAEVKAAVGGETLTTVTDIAARIIKPLADLKQIPGVLSVTWCTMMEPKRIPSIAAVNEAILSSPEVQEARVGVFDLRLLSGDERNLAQTEGDLFDITYADSIQNTLYKWFRNHVISILEISEAELEEITNKRDAFRKLMAEREQRKEEVRRLIDTKKEVLKETLKELEAEKTSAVPQRAPPRVETRENPQQSTTSQGDRKRHFTSPQETQFPKRNRHWAPRRGGPYHHHTRNPPAWKSARSSYQSNRQESYDAVQRLYDERDIPSTSSARQANPADGNPSNDRQNKTSSSSAKGAKRQPR